MAKRKKRRKRPGRKHYRFNIATIVAIVAVTYIVVRLIMSAMQPAISTYEVTSQKIYETIPTVGLAIRQEKVINTKQQGYLTYYIADGEKIAANSTVYAMDETGAISDKIKNETQTSNFSDDNYTDIKNQISTYKNTYSDSEFSSLYNFKYSLDNSIMEFTNDTVISQVDSWIANGEGDYTLKQFYAPESGVISYCYDGLENITKDSISERLFKNPENKMKQIRSNKIYDTNVPAYRLITEEDWDLAVSLTDEQYKRLKDEKYVKVKFLKDDLVVTRGVSFMEKNGIHYAIIPFNKYMERYMDERYLNIEIILKSVEGLKLPKSSLITSELYEIPKDFVVESNEVQSGIAFNLLKQDNNGRKEATIVSPSICYYDNKSGNYYVSKLDFDAGDTLIRNASEKEIKAGQYHADDTYTISTTKKFQGVYTINKGYAQFVVINNLYETDEFCIAQDNTEYGISQYDHIVVDSNSLKEGQVIY